MINKAHIKIGDVVYGSSNSVDIMYDENTNVYDKITDMSNTMAYINIEDNESVEYNTGWLKDNNGEKFAPKTLASQVITPEGISFEEKIQEQLDNINIGIEAAKSDWNQNDETASDYIKNRPFYEEEVPIEKLVFKHLYVGWWETEIDNLEMDDLLLDTTYKAVMPNGEEYILKENMETLSIGDNIIVSGTQWIGNTDLIPEEDKRDYVGSENTDVPFVIYSTFDSLSESWKPKVIKLDSSVKASMGESINLYELGDTETVIKQIEEKYIPTNVAKVSSASIGQILEVESVDEDGKPLSYIATDKTDLRNSVLTTTQELTEEQKMQARKNQGLYCEQTEIIYQGDNLVFLQENNLSVNIGFLDVEIGKTYSLYCDNSYVGNVSGVCEGDRRYDYYIIQFKGSFNDIRMTYENGILTWSTQFPWNSATVSITILEQSEIVQVEDKFIPDTIARKSDIPQSDWNQNDETAKDYIKNRPFFSSGSTTEIITNEREPGDEYYWEAKDVSVITTPITNRNYSLGVLGDYDSGICYGFITGERYNVIFDGISYDCTAIEPHDDNNIDGAAIGNKSIIDSTAEDTGEPFYIYKYFERPEYYPSYRILTNDTEETTHIISLYHIVDNVKQLDEKYIPDTIARVDYVDTAIADLVGSAPETLNTIQELATAIEEHKDVTDVLDAAITNKANVSDLNSHTSNTSNPHSVTKEQVGLSNVANVLQYSADNPPPYPVTSVNGKTGAVTLTSETWTFTLNDGSTVTKKVVVM